MLPQKQHSRAQTTGFDQIREILLLLQLRYLLAIIKNRQLYPMKYIDTGSLFFLFRHIVRSEHKDHTSGSYPQIIPDKQDDPV